MRLIIRIINLRPPLQNQWSGLVDLSDWRKVPLSAKRIYPACNMVAVRMASQDAPGANNRFYQLVHGRHPSFGSDG